MKTQVALLAILLLTGISAAYLPTNAEPTLTPHEDPATTQSNMDAYSFLAEYTTIFSLISNQLYENASRLSEQLSHITVPADWSYIINRYNNLTQQLINILNDLQGTLDSASSLLDQNRLNEADHALDSASVLVTKAQILLDDIKDVTTTVSQRLGAFSSAAQSSAQQAYNQLQSMLDKLSGLIERYHALLEKANQRVEEIKAENLDAVTLTLSLNNTACYVGSTVSAAGTLTSQGEPLGNRQIRLYIDGTQAEEAITDANGNYQTALEIPYTYANSTTIQAIYLPTGSDTYEYLAALSPTITLKLLFFTTNLEVQAPDVGYPGLPFTVTGKVTDADGQSLTDRQVIIALDGTKQTQGKTNQEGIFTAEFIISTQATLGKHTLIGSVDAQNLYTSALTQQTVTVQKMATNLQVETPTFVILPAQLEITGKASSPSGLLKGVTIQVEYTNIYGTIRTNDDGSFNLTIEAPLNIALAGSQELRIIAQPSEPWQATAETTKNIFALNSVSTSVALASSCSVFAVAYMKLTKNRKTERAVFETKQTITAIPPVDDKNNPASAFLSIGRIQISGSRGQIVQFYAETVTAVQTSTGIQLAPSMTLGEYAQAVKQEIGRVENEFRNLTGLTEKSLYSPHEPEPLEIKQAEALSKTIRRNLNAGT